MALIPITADTSFRDIAIKFECWILFGIIIICNSKNPKDSALKCFVFFLISQPLVYLIQVPLSIVVIFTAIFIILKGGIINSEFEIYKTLDDYHINFVGKIEVTSFSGTAQGDVVVVTSTDEIHSIRVNGRKNAKYEFTITDESEKEYTFEYFYDKNSESIVLNKR